MKVALSICLIVFCLVSCAFLSAYAQTYCSVKVPVPDRNYCDASGTLEVHVDSDVYETKGGIRVMQEYQEDLFKIFDQQFIKIVDQSKQTDVSFRAIEEEILALKDILGTIHTIQTTTGPTRVKRAATQTQTQQLIYASKLAFQQATATIGQKLQNLSKTLEDEQKQSAALHSTMATELDKNHQALVATEQQLQQINTAILQTQSSSSTGGGVNLTAVSQDVTQLIIDAAVAEKITQRQLDNIDQMVQQMVKDEASVTANVQSLKAKYSTIITALANDSQEVSTLQGAEKFIEGQQLRFLNQAEKDLLNILPEFTAAEADVARVGRSLFTETISRAGYSKDLAAYRNQVDSVQSLVTFSTQAQQTQTVRILNLKKEAKDNLNAMKYAFGILASLP